MAHAPSYRGASAASSVNFDARVDDCGDGGYGRTRRDAIDRAVAATFAVLSGSIEAGEERVPRTAQPCRREEPDPQM